VAVASDAEANAALDGRPRAVPRGTEEFLLSLEDAVRRLDDPQAIEDEATRLLMHELGGSRSLYVEMDDAATTFTAERDVHEEGAPSVTGRHVLDDFGPELMAELRAGATLVMRDVDEPSPLTQEQRGAYRAMGIGAHITAPLLKGGRLVALLSVHAPRPRAWTRGEIELVEVTAARTWDAVERARAASAVHASEERLRLAMASAHLMWWELDVATRVAIASDNSGALLGCGDAAGIDVLASLRRMADPEDAARLAEAVERTMAEGGGFSLELRARRPGAAETVWFEISGMLAGEGRPRLVGVVTSITERKRIDESRARDAERRQRAEGALRESETKYRSLFESVDEGFLLTELVRDEDDRDIDVRILEANPAAVRVFRRDLAGLCFSALDLEPPWLAIWSRVARSGHGERLERHAASIGAWFDFYVFPVDAPTGRKVAFVFQDVTKRKEVEASLSHARAQLFHRAHHDPLTGLPNRDLFEDRLDLAVAAARRHGRSLAVLFLDLDGFKLVNDSYGHDDGDLVLQEIARRLRAALRGEDTLARLHGDEFAVLLPEIASAAHIASVATTLLAEVGRPIALGSVTVVLSASIGVSVYPRDAGDADGLIRAADVAMYRVKVGGKSDVRFFDAGMRAPAAERVTLGRHFEGALERGELDLRFQPQWDSRTGSVTAFEALLRWTSPHLGEVSPERFVAIAEERGAFRPVVAWSLDRCGRGVRAISRAAGLPVRVALNVAPAQLTHPTFVHALDVAAERHRLEPHQLELELDGRAPLDTSVTPILAALRERGIRLALDHGAADAATVALLLELGLDGMKIDLSTVELATRDARFRSGLAHVVALVHELELDVSVVGVETAQQRDVMLDVGADRLQGYFFGRALASEEASEMVRSRQVTPLF
jgi:diguanylate cyclase (GGDEF)-like protein